MKKAIKYSFVLAFIFIVLFANLFFLMRISMRDGQSRNLESSATELFAQIQYGDFTDIQTNQKDVDFVIYGLKSKKILASSKDAIPLLPLAKGIQRYSLKNPKDSSKRIEILYLCRTYELSDGRMVCIQTSVPTKKELTQKLLALIPRSLLKILIPLLLILFVSFPLHFIVLEKKYDTQKEFIANVSHELKTPVAVISGHADLLRRHGKKLLEKDESRFDESVSLILKESENMTKIVRNLLELTRLENRLTKPQKEEINVQEFFEEIKDEANGKRNATVENILIEITPVSENLVIKTDRNLLRQIFSIAIDNSINHSKSQNLKITLGAEKSNRKTVLFVRDNGKGFSKEALSHAFDRFFSGDESHKTGSGIGLSIAKSIAKVLGAKIRLENDCGAVVKIIVFS
ncbi:MAG: HAMP domain-containing histidine kinase [Treponema sp.]|nr:HAMP domain-containing histidine kinase [Treponema sp.]